MNRYIPKKYGFSKTEKCPFCQLQATRKNEQGIFTCMKHAKEQLADIRCLCGSWLELCSGDYGPYFRCMKCGNRSFKKVMENAQAIIAKKETGTRLPMEKKEMIKQRREIIITTKDVEWFD